MLFVGLLTVNLTRRRWRKASPAGRSTSYRLVLAWLPSTGSKPMIRQ